MNRHYQTPKTYCVCGFCPDSKMPSILEELQHELPLAIALETWLPYNEKAVANVILTDITISTEDHVSATVEFDID